MDAPLIVPAASTVSAPPNSGRLKHTCEACSVAKVKCSGNQEIPCGRCKRRGMQCEFKFEKKRGRRKVEPSARKTCNAAVCWGEVVLRRGNGNRSMDWIDNKHVSQHFERRLFHLFFTIYKHHASPSSCCKEWFAFQLNKMCLVLIKQSNLSAMSRLMEWMHKHAVQVLPKEESFYQTPPPRVVDKDTGMTMPPVLGSKGPMFAGLEQPTPSKRLKSVTGKAAAALTVPEQKELTNMQHCPFLRIDATHEQSIVSVNNKFKALFGYSDDEINQVLTRLYGGFLPWGGDIMSLLFVNEVDVLAAIRILAIKFSQIGRPSGFPAVRKVFSTHSVDALTKSGDVVDCFVKMLHVENLYEDHIKVEIYMSLQPSGPVFNSSLQLAPLAELSLPQVSNCEITDVKEELDGQPINDGPVLDSDGIDQLGFDQDEWFEDLLDWTEGVDDA